MQRGEMELEVVRYDDETRLAFIGADDQGTRMLYLHRVDGLQMQHVHQVVIMGQCKAMLVATALIRAAHDCLGMSYRRDRVRFWAGVTPVMMDAWDTACGGVGGVTSGPELPTIRQKFPEHPSDECRAMLRRTAHATNVSEVADFMRQLGL